MRAPSLLNGAMLHASARVLTLGLGLALLIVVARLGPEVQGAFALFVAVESLLLALCSGLGLVLAREVSHTGASPASRVRALLRAATLLGLVAALPLAAWAAASVAEPYRHLWLLALAAPLVLWVPTASGLWLGQGRLLALNVPAVAGPALVLVIIVLVPGSPGVFGVLVAWVAGKALVALLTAAAALRGTAGAAPVPDLLRRHARFVAMVGLTNLISLLNLRATLFLVERLQGLAAAGVYSVAVQVAELLWVLSSAFTVAAYHRIGGADTAAAARVTLAALRSGLWLVLAAAPLLGAAGWLLLPWLGPDYVAARVPLLVLLPGVVLYAGASSLSAYYTNLHGRPQWAARVAALSLAIALAGALLAVPRWGALGAALATTLAYTLSIALACRGFLREQGWRWRVLWAGPPAPQSRPA
jgi:O-antigen/teichoic acid export membrane protein